MIHIDLESKNDFKENAQRQAIILISDCAH